MDAFIQAFCDFVYKHMWMNRNRNRNSLEKSRCDSSITLKLVRYLNKIDNSWDLSVISLLCKNNPLEQ